jgi:hypothetical protein
VTAHSGISFHQPIGEFMFSFLFKPKSSGKKLMELQGSQWLVFMASKDGEQHPMPFNVNQGQRLTIEISKGTASVSIGSL